MGASLLFTDVEGTTQLQHRLQERYREVVNVHRRLLEEAIESNDGLVVDRQTESFFAVFPRMRNAAAQRALAAQEWPDGVEAKVRMGMHAGEPELEGDRYVGLAVARAARIAATAHGGQVLLSAAACGLLPERSRGCCLPPSWTRGRRSARSGIASRRRAAPRFAERFPSVNA